MRDASVLHANASVGPMDAWHQHQHGRHSFECRLRIYVYENYATHLQEQQHSGRHFGYPGVAPDPSRNVSCLEAPCIFDSFGYNNIRQYTAEVPIYQRLVTACKTTTDPDSADVFLVPFYFGYMMTLGWQVKSKQMPLEWKLEHREMMRDAIRVRHSLQYLNASTAARHIFLFTCDSQFVNLDLNPHLRRSLVVHLGDDAFGGNTAPENYLKYRGRHHMPNGVIVPYRVSQWLPFGFTAPSVGPRRFLLSMNVNMERAVVRRVVAAQVRADAARLSVPSSRLILRSGTMAGPTAAADVALNSTFCLCPTGDSKGFTARFYFVLLHGCIPVRVDGYRRNATHAPATYPFPLLIDWSKIVVDVPVDVPVLPQLLNMSDHEIEERQSHLRRAAHWFLYDLDEHAHHDASAATIHAIQHQVLTLGEM